MLTIRRAQPADLDAITAIYNHAILTTAATFDIQPKTPEEQEAWFAQHDDKYPLLVAEQDGRVVAWGSLSRWSDRCAYTDTGEGSLYVEEGLRGQGLGRQLAAALLEAGRAGGLHTVIARIVAGNEPSLRLCRSLGFVDIGTMREVGRKFGRLLDVQLLQYIYP